VIYIIIRAFFSQNKNLMMFIAFDQIIIIIIIALI